MGCCDVWLSAVYGSAPPYAERVEEVEIGGDDERSVPDVLVCFG